MKVGEILVKGGNLNQKELEYALKVQEREGGKIGEILIRLGYITDKALIDALTQQVKD
ncbi:MAG: hypothetical protein MI922_17275 [Bacteroidales bacterium]|nr:hypothetical protein [Bacteroidales bacterium]